MVVNAPRGSERWAEGASGRNFFPSAAAAMASCASFNSSARSSGENSAMESASASSGGGDIVLPPPAQDEGPLAPLHHAPVNLRPERNKVIDCGEKRQKDHEPD